MLVVILLFVIWIAYWIWNRHHKSTEPPIFPGAWPIIGHFPLIWGDNTHIWRVLNYITDKSYSFGGVVSMYMGPRTVYVITDPDDGFTVANSCLEKDTFYDFGKPWLGEGLVTGKLSIWKHHRKLLNPAFSQTVLDGFLGIFNKQSKQLVKELAVEVGKGPFNHWPYIRHNALETICLTALNVDFTDHTILNNQYVEAMENLLVILMERFKKFWLHSPYTFRFSELKRRQDACVKILHNMSQTVLQRKKSELKRNIPAEEITDKVPGTKFKAFMDLLLDLAEEKGIFNDREIREHVDTIIAAGHDTSANAIMYTMMLLGSYPEIQERAYAEIREVLGDSDRDVDKQDLSKLVYVEAVLKESLRMYSIVPLIFRRLDKDVTLKNCTLRAGRTCFILLFGMHRHPVWGPDADKFKPERWLDPSSLPKTPNAFASFSMGRRMCIGKTYALMSMKMTVAYLLRNYRITSDHTKLVLKYDVMLKPVSGHSVSFERRM